MAVSTDKQNSQNLHPSIFNYGDTTVVRHLRDSSPKMVVREKVMAEDARGRKTLDQVLVFWFNAVGDYCEKHFNYLDLEVIARAQDSGYHGVN